MLWKAGAERNMQGAGMMFVLIFYTTGKFNYHHIYLLDMRKHRADVSGLQTGCHTK